ncbi:hypothetical protein X943_001777 [Babesia divergens]|uniref:Prokaryotic-type class I peptide chain release factors domain-containing protein n=1 Tax=Babesia divergens TaxID=32595 RepID=A0AAD9G700_BABDI|nr:hypothetical protein X943_001777 [Babesia divergens]
MFLSKLHLLASPRRSCTIKVPINKVKLTTSRSSGPGGQSVNKSETKVQARFNVSTAEWLPNDIKEKFLDIHKNRISQAGYFVVESDEFSSQEQNRKACFNKINEAIEQAEEYSPEVKLSFLEQIQQSKSPEEIRKYNQNRRENKRKLKRIGHKTLADF